MRTCFASGASDGMRLSFEPRVPDQRPLLLNPRLQLRPKEDNHWRLVAPSCGFKSILAKPRTGIAYVALLLEWRLGMAHFATQVTSDPNRWRDARLVVAGGFHILADMHSLHYSRSRKLMAIASSSKWRMS